MKIESDSFPAGGTIPEEFAFCKMDATTHASFSANRNPELRWSGVPEAAKSLVLLCVDTDVPTRPDDVNQEGRTVPAELPRADFYHWVMVDVPLSCRGVAAGECSDGVTAGGKQDPPGPEGSRQGLQDYTAWFDGDPQMGGKYFGYDGPAPPWNDELLHHYHFRLIATDLPRCPVEGDFSGPQVLEAIAGHVLAEAEVVGTYTLNPELS